MYLLFLFYILTTTNLVCPIHLAATASFIDDACPLVDVEKIRMQAAKEELALVFYYVSWYSQSVDAKNVFEEVAQIYKQQQTDGYFATVDCWNLACNCSRTHPTRLVSDLGSPNNWPTMMVYLGRQTLQYHGIWKFEAIMRFLHNLLKPVDRIHNQHELKNLVARSDAVVLGLFKDHKSEQYRRFAIAAVKWLETDVERSFRFAIAFGVRANFSNNISPSDFPKILLIKDRNVEVFNATTKWNALGILTWVQAQLTSNFGNIFGYATIKTLAMRLRSRAVLAVFVNGNTFYKNMANFVHMQTAHSNAHVYNLNQCSKHNAFETARQPEMNKESQSCIIKEYLSGHYLRHYYLINEYLNILAVSLKCRITNYEATDLNSSTKLLTIHKQKNYLNPLQHAAPELNIAISKYLKNVADNEWRTALIAERRYNNTLSVLVLDADKNIDFLHQHEIRAPINSDAAVLTIDPNQECVFVMSEPFTVANFRNFVKNLYENNIPPQRKSSSLILPSALHSVYMHDFNRQMLMQLFPSQNRTTVLLLHSPACAFSYIMTHTLTQITALLTSSTNAIQFVRINTQQHELPWELEMHATPTLLVFPRDRFAESRIFPAHLKINMKNVLQHILAQLAPLEQVRVVLATCQRSLLPQHIRSCLLFAKTLVVSHIGQHLKYWQLYENDRHVVLERLKQLKDITYQIRSSLSV